VPALVVTHSFEEGASLTAEMVIVEHGRVAQRGSARDLLERPRSAFVARFAGANTLAGTARGTTVTLDRGGVVRVSEPLEGRVSVVVAPWAVRVARDGAEPGAEANRLAGTVEQTVPLGDRVRVSVAGVTAEVAA